MARVEVDDGGEQQTQLQPTANHTKYTSRSNSALNPESSTKQFIIKFHHRNAH